MFEKKEMIMNEFSERSKTKEEDLMCDNNCNDTTTQNYHCDYNIFHPFFQEIYSSQWINIFFKANSVTKEDI